MDSTDFPDNLVQLQRAWNAAYEALPRPAPATPRPCAAACCSYPYA